jgi:hypothetical protein
VLKSAFARHVNVLRNLDVQFHGINGRADGRIENKNPGWKNNMITNFALLCKTNKVNIPCATTHMQYKKHTHKPENKKEHNICSNHNVQMHRKQTQNNDCPV